MRVANCTTMGASCWVSCCEMVALVPMRWTMSPGMRWEKNSMGMWRTFHRKLELAEAAILPSTRSKKTLFRTEITTCTRLNAPRSTRNGTVQSAFLPVSRRSRKTCEKIGETIPRTEAITLVRATKTRAALAPRRRLMAKSMTEAGLPPGSKSSVGTNCRMTPVNSRSNSSKRMVFSPPAGSFT